jgi:hypothetical protein
MGTPTNQVISQLKDFGSKLGDFVQSSEGEHLQAGQVDEGFCKGVCIDWTRRVLQNGKPAFTSKEDRKADQAVRQATLQLNIESRNAAHSSVVSVSNELVDAYNAQLSAPLVNISAELEHKLETYITFEKETTRKYDRAYVNQWLSLLRSRAARNDHTSEVGFAEFVRVMDDKHLQIRQQQVREKSNRPFSHLKILASQNSKDYPTIPGAITQLLNLNTFVSGTVLILGFGLLSPTSTAGHAVAVHKVTNVTFRFLDPNYGIFEYNRGGLASALNYLFGTHYGTPIYGEDNSQVTGSVSHIVIGLTD